MTRIAFPLSHRPTKKSSIVPFGQCLNIANDLALLFFDDRAVKSPLKKITLPKSGGYFSSNDY